MTSSTLARPVIDFAPRNHCLDIFHDHSPIVVLAGPAGTGKSRAALEKLNACALKYDGMRGLILRKARSWLTQTAMVTFEEEVNPFFHGARFSTVKQAYQYPNHSAIVVGGLDKDAQKVMSSDYDLIYVQEGIEISEDDCEKLTTRLRHGTMPYQQLLIDCNPGPPTHWIKKRAERGGLVLYESRHEDNPVLFDEQGQLTDRGRDYLGKLDGLTGVRYLRLRAGKWAAAEGIVYEDWDPELHLIDRRPLPRTWTRWWVVDFGFVHPFVWQAWAEDEDGRLYLEHEIHLTGRLVEDHARHILELTGWRLDPPFDPQWPDRERRYRPAREDPDPLPRALICDHDAEDRATLERHLGVATYAAFKSVTTGLQLVQARLRKAGDGRPRLFVVRDSLVELDPWAVEHKRPACLSEEIEAYSWDNRPGVGLKEQPLKVDDDSMDCVRYLCATLDDPRPQTGQTVIYEDRVTIGPRL